MENRPTNYPYGILFKQISPANKRKKKMKKRAGRRRLYDTTETMFFQRKKIVTTEQPNQFRITKGKQENRYPYEITHCPAENKSNRRASGSRSRYRSQVSSAAWNVDTQKMEERGGNGRRRWKSTGEEEAVNWGEEDNFHQIILPTALPIFPAGGNIFT